MVGLDSSAEMLSKADTQAASIANLEFRLGDIAAWTPGDPPRLHGLEGIGRAWMKHPALGPGWSAWRA